MLKDIIDCVGDADSSNCAGYGCYPTEMISNSLLTVVGPITLISNKMCLCERTPTEPKYYGVSCSADTPPADDELCGHCQNNGTESTSLKKQSSFILRFWSAIVENFDSKINQ